MMPDSLSFIRLKSAGHLSGAGRVFSRTELAAQLLSRRPSGGSTSRQTAAAHFPSTRTRSEPPGRMSRRSASTARCPGRRTRAGLRTPGNSNRRPFSCDWLRSGWLLVGVGDPETIRHVFKKFLLELRPLGVRGALFHELVAFDQLLN